jgi:mannosyltransferase OCH1-like enzyme
MLFVLVTAAVSAAPAIPSQLFVTTKDGTPDRLPEALRRNVERNVELNKDLELTWYGDAECLSLLNSTYPDAAELFQSLRHGANKADLCRAAYLAKNGGFYLDTDVELKVPLSSLVGPETQFLTLN